MSRSRASVRLIDVAERAGVSIATASRALAGTHGVSSEAAQRVQLVATELGYVANVHARSLAGGATSSIGLIVHEIGDPYFSEIASGVLRVATAQGQMVQICHAGRDPEVQLAQIRALVANRVGAIIVAGSGFVDPSVEARSKEALYAFEKAGGRVAVIGRHHLRVDAVLPDNREGGRSIAEHLLSLGHRRIAVASGSLQLTTIADRLAGIEEVLADHGMSMKDVHVIETEFTRAGGKIAAARVLEEHGDVTALMTLNDAMATGVLSALRARGVDVPGQISVAGFDDVPVAEDLAPSLTTVRLPMAEMGEMALRMALRPRSSKPRRKLTGHTLVVRDSTGPAPTLHSRGGGIRTRG